MIADEETQVVVEEIRRLAGKRGWPREIEAQHELVRVAQKYARDVAHLNAAITKLSEDLEYCPDARELKLELQGRADPAFSDVPLWKGFTPN